MSETPIPSKGQTMRRGLALPPRGQALARLQDLEQDLEEESEQSISPVEKPDEEVLTTEVINALNTASSNAVNHQGNTLKPNKQGQALQEPAPVIVTPTAITAGHQLQVRAAREPTTRITVDMPDSLHQKISVLSAQTRRSIKDLVIEALTATYFGAGPDPQ